MVSTFRLVHAAIRHAERLEGKELEELVRELLDGASREEREELLTLALVVATGFGGEEVMRGLESFVGMALAEREEIAAERQQR